MLTIRTILCLCLGDEGGGFDLFHTIPRFTIDRPGGRVKPVTQSARSRPSHQTLADPAMLVR